MATSKQASPILPSSKIEEPRSDTHDLVGSIDTHPVMAEAISRDVVNQSLSVGDHSPADVPATNHHESATRGDEVKQSSSEQEGISHEFQHGGPVKAVDALVAPVCPMLCEETASTDLSIDNRKHRVSERSLDAFRCFLHQRRRTTTRSTF